MVTFPTFCSLNQCTDSSGSEIHSPPPKKKSGNTKIHINMLWYKSLIHGKRLLEKKMEKYVAQASELIICYVIRLQRKCSIIS